MKFIIIKIKSNDTSASEIESYPSFVFLYDVSVYIEVPQGG